MDWSNDAGTSGSNKRRRTIEDRQINQNNRPTNQRRRNRSGGAKDDCDEFLSLSLSLPQSCSPPPLMSQLNEEAHDNDQFLSLALAHTHPLRTLMMTSPSAQNHVQSPLSPALNSQPTPMTSETSSMALLPAATNIPQPPLRFSPPFTFHLLDPPPQPSAANYFFPPSPYAEPQHSFLIPPVELPVRSTVGTPRGGGEQRRSNMTHLKPGKTSTIPPPYQWATNHRATVHSLDYLQSNEVTAITGDVQCKHCDKTYQISYDLSEKFSELEKFIKENKLNMRERAPTQWMNPVLPRCRLCDREKVVKPVIAERKRDINWLFMLLGQTLGCCTLDQLKYFCKHSNNHRTGAKDRVLYLTYLSLCKQLKPCSEVFTR